jgi:hypothetical protein
MSWTIAGKYVRASATDPDAQAYLQAVEAADGQALEFEVARAIDNFVLGCKADGIWTAIKASCILAGARTRLGALTPLVGTAPTSFNFVDDDYNRKTGLVGNGSTKYLNANRANNADPQNSSHCSVYCSAAATLNSFPAVIGVANFNIPGWSTIYQRRGTRWEATIQGLALLSVINGANENAPAFLGVTRASASTAAFRGAGFSVTGGGTSNTPGSQNWFVFRDAAEVTLSNARIAFYSIGESLDLALLDARVTTLINAFDTAIPS